MTNRTFIFTGCGINGTIHRVSVQAVSMAKAVATFSAMTKPATMGWRVASEGSKTTHPVTRERWGHSFDGQE